MEPSDMHPIQQQQHERLRAGFDTDLLTKDETEVDDDLKCMFCLGILNNPIECNKCQKSFCKSCLHYSKRSTHVV